MAGKDVTPPTVAAEAAAAAAAANPALLVMEPGVVEEAEMADVDSKDAVLPAGEMLAPPGRVSVKMGFQSKPKNVFAGGKEERFGRQEGSGHRAAKEDE